MTLQQLASITSGQLVNSSVASELKSIVLDSRKPFIAQGAVFFALVGQHHNGHEYIKDLYQRGVRLFVVEQPRTLPDDASILIVKNTTQALQQLSAAHRQTFDIPVIAITGSNGKTITKEWLFSCLTPLYRIARSPQSYNSQIGVPLSVWNLSKEHTLAIFEAGISKPNEMQKLEEIIQPTLGIFTNLGSAHAEGFESDEQKFKEKAKLFDHVKRVIFNGDDDLFYQTFKSKAYCWGNHQRCDVQIVDQQSEGHDTIITLKNNSRHHTLKLPFSDSASIENIMHCVTMMLYMELNMAFIQERINKLSQVKMRLELKKAVNNCYLIDDTYNNDLGGLQHALEFLARQNQRKKKVVVLSDILQSGLTEENLYTQVAQLLKASKIDEFIGIGKALNHHHDKFERGKFYDTTEAFLSVLEDHNLQDAILLIKGARLFSFEKIVKVLEEKIHGTVLEINLDALTNNLNFYRSKLASNTKLMIMVKAFAYGSGSHEIASLMQFHRADYLGVAYADEGIYLRENGIYLPIMVMNPSEESYEALLKYDLEPEIYGVPQLKRFIAFLDGREAGIHIKLETGMKRLGFESAELPELISLLQQNSNLKVKTVFSHLAGADDDAHTDFSKKQADLFYELSSKIKGELAIKPLLHLVNSPGILRYPQYHFDMVRLGIGLYGLESNNSEWQKELQTISTLKTVISQIRTVKAGETVGYGRKGEAQHDMRIATIAIGYADGFSRSFSQGVGEVFINGQRAKVMGNVCMDMTMIDVTSLKVAEGDEVEIFGTNVSIKELAEKINTIPYEILTNVSQRVKRVYFTE